MTKTTCATPARRGSRVAAVLAGAAVLTASTGALAARPKLPTRSTSIALYRNDNRLLVVNREANSVSIIAVRRKNADVGVKLAELTVGGEPRCVAVGAKEREAYVANAATGTVSVVALTGENTNEVIAEFPVGLEPRGCATTPNGKRLFVTNYTEGTVTVVDTKTRTIERKVAVGGNPWAVAVTNDGDKNDDDETVFVSQFFAEPIPGGPGEGFDDGKRAVVQSFSSVGTGAITRITLSPLANAGFAADRKSFCTKTNATAANDTFCPDTTLTDPANVKIAQDPQGAFPNQLAALLVRGGQVIVPSIGAAPEPPIKFNVNVQGLVHTIDRTNLAEVTALTTNLNNQIKAETQPDPAAGRLERLFANDVVALDATGDGKTVLFVSRGGNVVLKATRGDDGAISIGAPANVVRFQTGNLPDGVVVSKNGQRAYVSNSAGLSVSVLNLAGNTVLTRDLPASTPPVPGSFEHARLVGKLVFFTALGTPDNGLLDTDIRDIVPLAFRNKASDNGWSSCSSCHPDGLSDGVTWIFATGPRNTLPLDAFFSKLNSADQRISNWSGIQGSLTDFNNNSRGVQGGIGFAGDPPNPDIFNHGIASGASEALDMETLWAETIRPLNRPQPADVSGGAAVFELACASCHGGAKWTKSQVIYLNNPARIAAAVRDPGLDLIANQSTSYTDGVLGGGTLFFLEDAGTFDEANAIEIRQNGQAPLGADGFNVPSLIGVGAHAPYFHDGSAQTLVDVLDQHAIGGTPISTLLGAADQASLLAFLRSIDGRTALLRSETDDFKAPLP
jgi:YVTN family beta-propeller protein